LYFPNSMCVVKSFPFHVRLSRNGRGGKVGGDVQMKESENARI
jgi:hypothetical protein